MDSVLSLAWCQGYDGSKIAYLDPDVLSYKCGRNLKTINTADGKHDSFSFKANSVGAVAVHGINKHIAVAEFGLNPKIYVYAYPTYAQVSVLEGGAEYNFQAIVFSESDYLASISGAPSFSMVLWNYHDGTMLTSVTLSPEPVIEVSFNKANWRQICVMTKTTLTLWDTEQSNTKYVLLPQKIKLPPVEDSSERDQDKDDDEAMERSPTKMSKYAVQIPDSSVAGLVGQQVEQLDEIKDLTERVVPTSLTWLPTGDFYVGCEGGQLFMVDSDIMKVRILYKPPPEDLSDPFDRGLTAVSRGETDMPPSATSSVVSDTSLVILKPGSLDCLRLHQTGLFAAGSDSRIRRLDVSGEELKILEEFDAGCVVSSMCFNTNYQKLTWGSPDGCIRSYTLGKKNSVSDITSVSQGNVVGVGSVAIGSESSVSLRDNGQVQVWKTTDGTLMSEVSTHEPGEIIACSRVAQYAVVGTKGGQLCFIDLTNPSRARVVLKHRLFKSPIKHLVFNGDRGTLLFVASDDNLIFLVDARPTNGFTILGYVALTGNIQSMATYVKDHDTCVVVAVNNNANIFGSNLLFRLNFSDDLIRDIRFNYKSPMCDIKEESCHMLKMGLRHAICGLAIGEGEMVFALDAATKKLITIVMPEHDKKLKKIDLLLSASSEYPGHELPGGDLLFSPHMKWLATYAPDGRVKVRSIGALERTSNVVCHEYSGGGVRAVTFSDDCQYILSAGYDGVVNCYHWNHLKKQAQAVSSAKLKRERDMDFVGRENQKLTEYQEWNQRDDVNRRASLVEKERRDRIEQAKQEAQSRDEIYASPPPSPRANATWLEQRHIDALRQENEHYSGVKRDLRSQIRDIRKTIQGMMTENGDLPEIEKLSRHEFDLDLEEQNRLQAEGEAEIKKVREDIEFDNLAKIYLREKIKEECWDNMNIKGRALQAFNSSLEVSNFPLRERTLAMLNAIKIVSARRKIEIKEQEAKKQIIENSSRPVVHDEEGEGEEEKEPGQEHPSITGSLGAKYGGGNELFYNQFELHTREQKMQQIVLLEDAIHNIKEAFNKEFDEVYSKKEGEITKTKDKNKRIRYIIKYLDLLEEVSEPAMSIAEKPEQLLEVDDDEITVEKYLTPEQRKKLEEEQKAEEERIAKEKGDNARERALDMMMGGVLEIKKEDELKKDVPKPAFMMTKKEDEYSEDEVKLFKEYQKKVQELNEEREKYRKQLETELRKHQGLIQENLQAFDDALNVLFMRKIKVMMVIYQEELKILRLRHSMLIQEEIETREADLTETLDHSKHLKQLAFEAVNETRKNVDNFRNEYDNLQAEDKYVDKSFRRDFGDVSAVMVDALYKQFKRRPRVMKYKALESLGNKANNPFSDRPSSSMQLSQQNVQMHHALDDLDKMTHAPEGCDSHIWERMCKLRRAKVETEALLKSKSNTLAEMLAFMQKRQDEDERLKKEIDDVSQQLSRLKEDEQRFTLNLEVQLLLKQGQIEVDAGPFIRDFRDSVLIHRSVVEDLNHTIKQLGESKIASMVESKDFRKGIIQLEWEHKKMSMQMEDLQNKMKDIQFIKVTREIQAFLQEDDYDAKKAAEIATLEQTILLQKQFHEKKVQEKKKALRDLSRNVKTKGSSNFKLDKDLLDLNVVVNERRLIDEVNVDSHQEGLAEKRYMEIVQRRKLVDLAKAQAQEVAVLRAEVERLRMRTFPALVQVER